MQCPLSGVAPGASKIGLLTNLQDPKAPPQAQELTDAAKALEVEIVTADAGRPEEIDGALHALARQRVDIAIVLQTSMLLSERNQILSRGSWPINCQWCLGIPSIPEPVVWSAMGSICPGAFTGPLFRRQNPAWHCAWRLAGRVPE